MFSQSNPIIFLPRAFSESQATEAPIPTVVNLGRPLDGLDSGRNAVAWTAIKQRIRTRAIMMVTAKLYRPVLKSSEAIHLCCCQKDRILKVFTVALLKKLQHQTVCPLPEATSSSSTWRHRQTRRSRNNQPMALNILFSLYGADTN